MNDKTTQFLNFFQKMRRRWVWGLLFIPLLAGINLLLEHAEDTENVVYPILIIVDVGLIIFELLWLLSYILVPYLNYKQRAALRPKKKKESKVALSSSRMLSRAQKMRAWANLNELKQVCLPRFKGRYSYVRLQWPYGDTFLEEIRDLQSSFSKQLTFNKYGCIESCEIFVSQGMDEKGREHVFVSWVPLSAGADALKTADTIELVRNEPAVLAYGMTYDREDGVTMVHEEPVCIITWIGGAY